jgi:hypothetical protein
MLYVRREMGLPLSVHEDTGLCMCQAEPLGWLLAASPLLPPFPRLDFDECRLPSPFKDCGSCLNLVLHLQPFDTGHMCTLAFQRCPAGQYRDRCLAARRQQTFAPGPRCGGGARVVYAKWGSSGVRFICGPSGCVAQNAGMRHAGSPTSPILRNPRRSPVMPCFGHMQSCSNDA